jgi:molybdate transport system permease protein
MKHSLGRVALIMMAGTLVAFLALPLLSLTFHTGFGELWLHAQSPMVISALGLSAFTTTSSLALTLAFGVPLAWTLANSQSRWARIIEATLQLPLVIPPAVAGISLLLAFGRHGYLTRLLHLDSGLAFTQAAVITAEVFVAAPYFVQGATSAFRGIDPGALLAARTLGAGPLRVLAQIAVPIALPGLTTAAAMSWARALGEFGATLMFAGNFEGRTQTMPLAIYSALESDFQAAATLGVMLLVLASTVLIAGRALSRTHTA